MRLSPALLWPALLALLAGCTVYAPVPPTLPLLTQAGQADLGAGVQPSGRLDLSGAYSPFDHVVLLGGLSAAPRLGEQVFLATRQYELGAGLYQALPLGSAANRVLLGAQAGFGQAYAHRGFEELFGGYAEFTASYRTRFGQVGVAFLHRDRVAISFTYRLVDVQFDYLRDAYGPVALDQMLRHELSVQQRYGLGHGGRWQAAVTLGTSLSSTRAPDNGSSSVASNQNTLPAFFASAGLVYRLGKGH